jgi:hypothetical protein
MRPLAFLLSQATYLGIRDAIVQIGVPSHQLESGRESRCP